ncbi:hypothetical protein ACIQPQ_34590 [Streptomyces sp. NPDC091281]|uniref:hypothetical protein n=1 Tax=Streptomyces sp. NPDC091281 TaxID=3365985 RepID=UPI00382F49A8
MSTTDLERELCSAIARLHDGSDLKGLVDSDNRDLLAFIRALLRLPEPLAQWLDQQARLVAASGMYDVLAIDVARAINGDREPGRGEDWHIEDRLSRRSLYEQLAHQTGEQTCGS